MNESLEIKKISLIKFYINNLEEHKGYVPIKNDDVNLFLSTDSNYDEENEVFNIILMLSYETIVNNESVDILNADIKFEFTIPQKSKFFTPSGKKINSKEKNKSYDVNDSFFSLILSICISTLRGIILEKCRGTFLENIYLPIVDINKLRKNNKEKSPADNMVHMNIVKK
jgi:hypothetical protein